MRLCRAGSTRSADEPISAPHYYNPFLYLINSNRYVDLDSVCFKILANCKVFTNCRHIMCECVYNSGMMLLNVTGMNECQGLHVTDLRNVANR